MIPSQYYFTVRPFLASCEQTVRGATRESLVRFSLGLFAHLVIDLRRDSIIPLPLFPVTLTSVSFMVARLAAWGFSPAGARRARREASPLGPLRGNAAL